jgi:acetyl esterase/lipase
MLHPVGIAVAGQVYRGDMAADDPRCSPLFGNQADLPPALVQVGSQEILLDDSRHFADKVQAAGGAVKFDVWRKMHHVWHLSAQIVPEGRRAIADMAAFFDSHWGN